MAKGNKDGKRGVATVKQTAGAGFMFEDKVTAWLCSYFLLNKNPFTPDHGKINKIKFQSRADGWLLDDMVLTMATSTGVKSHIAVSSKSNKQFTATGPKSDLLYDLWNQFLNSDDSGLFDQEKDYLCVITSPLGTKVSEDLNNIIKSANAQGYEVFHKRILQGDKSTSESMRKLYNGFSCPENLLTKLDNDDSLLAKLLSRMLILEFDFENVISNYEKMTLQNCRELLLDPSPENESKLYETLTAIRAKFGEKGGYVDRQRLTETIRHKFQLKGFPNHEQDWQQINIISRQKLAAIPDKIGGEVSLDVSKELQDIAGLTETNNVIFILAKSGYGKSSLVKKLIQDRETEHNPIVFIDSSSTLSESLEGYFGLKYRLTELFEEVQQQKPLLVVDGIDRFFKEHLNKICEVLKIAFNPESPWTVLFTCQTEDYEAVLHRLYTLNINFKPVTHSITIDSLSQSKIIIDAFPALDKLFKLNHLKDILKNLKYLDLLAYNYKIKSEMPISYFVGESTLIDWIWKSEFNTRGPAAEALLQEFSVKQAEQMAISIPSSDFSVSERQHLGKLDNIIKQSNGKLLLVHDLFGDWARYQLLIANRDNIKNYLLSKELLSPLWGKAIRLYGIYLLDENKDGSLWESFFMRFDHNIAKEKIIQDHLLESLLFCVGATDTMTLLTENLTKNEGAVLKRLLDQFLLKATLPNEAVLEIAKNIEGVSTSEAATLHRIPNIRDWRPMLEFLYKNQDSVLPHSRERVAKITAMWLEYIPEGLPLRKIAGEIAINNAKAICRMDFHERLELGKADRTIFLSFMFAINELPAEVEKLALHLCRRNCLRQLQAYPEEVPAVDSRKDSVFPIAGLGGVIREAIHWPHGPLDHPDDDFEHICLNQNGMNRVIQHNPTLAKEILFAFFISPPREIHFSYGNYDLEISSPMRWNPPFYTRGPFLYFINNHPEEALDFIIGIVNFATERWAEKRRYQYKEVTALTVKYQDGDKCFTGDNRMYFWHRDIAQAPDVLVCILQVLEHFLMARIDAGDTISHYLSRILKEGESVAFLGVINSIGKYYPPLFLSELLSHLQVLDFHVWEKVLDNGSKQVEGYQLMNVAFLESYNREKAIKWHQMPHRTNSITTIALDLFLKNSHLWAHFEPITIEWAEILRDIEAAGDEFPFLDNLISFFNIINYNFLEGNIPTVDDFIRPESLNEKYLGKSKEALQAVTVQMLPFRCLQFIESGKQLSIENSEKLWKDLQEIANEYDEEPYSPYSGLHQKVLGYCSVLLFSREAWIGKYPDWEQWIHRYTTDVVEQYAPGPADNSLADVNDSWTAFAARTVGVLYSAYPNDTNIRKLTALLVIKSPYETANVLFHTVSRLLKWNDSNFVELQNFVIMRSLQVDRERKVKNYHRDLHLGMDTKLRWYRILLSRIGVLSLSETEARMIDQVKLVSNFSKGKLSKSLVEWSLIRPKQPKRKDRYAKLNTDYDIGNYPGLDKSILQHAFVSIGNISAYRNRQEREYKINFWEKMLEQLTFELGDASALSFPRESYPKTLDHWILTNVAPLCLLLEPSDNRNAADFWKPVVSYGYLADYWVNNFFRALYGYVLDNDVTHDTFFENLDNIISYVDNLDTWKSNSYVRRNKDVWSSLFGLSDEMILLWNTPDDTKEFAIDQMKRIKEWAVIKDPDSFLAGRMAALIQTHHGELIVDTGLGIIHDYLKSVTESGQTPEYEESLSRATGIAWEKYGDIIKNDDRLYTTFKNIVMILVSKQNTIGIELQREIISS